MELSSLEWLLAWAVFTGAALALAMRYPARCESVEDLMLVAMLHG